MAQTSQRPVPWQALGKLLQHRCG